MKKSETPKNNHGHPEHDVDSTEVHIVEKKETNDHKKATKTATSDSTSKYKQKSLYVAGLVVFLFGVGAYYFLQDDSVVENDNASETQLEDAPDMFALSDTLEASGDIEGALEVYDQLIAEEDDPVIKANYVVAKASILQRDGDIERATALAQESITVYESVSGLLLLGALQEKDEPSAALESYVRAKEKLLEADVIDKAEIRFLDKKIEELGNR